MGTRREAFGLALAELAGLDPSKMITDSIDVTVEPDTSGNVHAFVTGQVQVPVNPDAVLELAAEHGVHGISPSMGDDEDPRLD